MSAGIAVKSLSLALGAFRLHGVDLAVSRGEILVILGPNGAGKSVTLETIAGFHRPDSGRILIGGRDVTAWTPERRNVGFVVQNFGLFPHLTVAQNVAIGRRAGRNPVKAMIARDDAGLLSHFGIAHLAQRWPQDLSPGEQQRVALARALASASDLFLFDEPFAALDAQIREQLRGELLAFLRTLAVPAIFVTHDRDDAVTLADRVAVLRDGGVVQEGARTDIFARPATSFVARFVGVENVFEARFIETTGAGAMLGIGAARLQAASPAPAPAAAGQSVCVAIRGEQVTISPDRPRHAPSSAVNRFDGRVRSIRSLSPLVIVEVDCGFPLKGYLLAPQAAAGNIEAGKPVAVEIAADAVHVMPD